jgi:hypothetical protein
MASRFTIAAILVLALINGVSADEPKVDAKLKEQIAKSIKGGQEYLKAARRGQVGGNGLQPGAVIIAMGGNQCGTPALTGLALIESGLDAKDPLVNGLANGIRQAAMSTTNTYEISLIIMFLDRVGAKTDEGLLQFLTLRLMSGQNSDGTWSYSCDGIRLDPVEERSLHAELVKESKLTTPSTPRPKGKPREDIDEFSPKKEPPAKKDEPKEEKPKLHPALDKIARSIVPSPGRSGDHSNTQFATVGMWCGRRHAIDVADSLALLDKHYRQIQSADGGWTYTGSAGTSSPAMTCAGLMGLAMGFGGKNLDGDPKKADLDAIAKDKVVEAGLKCLGDYISAAGDQRNGDGFRPNNLSNNHYFMWSLERVGMVYGLTTIGKVDWYDWGARILLKTQNQRDGSWPTDGFHSGSTENATAFALLFLSRANLAEDLSTSLKGKVKDPGTSRLVRGGDLDDLLGKAGTGSSSKRPDNGTTASKDPPAVTERDPGGRLADALISAGAAEREKLLATYRDSKGGEYTDALARAATKMTGDGQTAVRDALAQRMTRMTPSTLNDCMRDRDRELRRAAALAAAAKGKERLALFAENLIRLIADDETLVAQAARATLKTLSGKDFGPEAGVSAADRAKALIAWRNWWALESK